MPSFDWQAALKLGIAAAAVDYFAGGMISGYITPSDANDNTRSALRTGGSVFATVLVLQNI